MIATTPLEIDGQTYDRYTMTLAVSGRYVAPDQPDASVVLTLTPARFDGEQIHVAPESRTVLFGTLANADDDARVAVAEVQAALQKFINAKGL
jgi:hypothetical protein